MEHTSSGTQQHLHSKMTESDWLVGAVRQQQKKNNQWQPGQGVLPHTVKEKGGFRSRNVVNEFVNKAERNKTRTKQDPY